MNRPFSSLSSVTRWLLVVVGCAVLETAQPTKAAEPSDAPSAAATPAEAAAAERTGETLLIPGGRDQPANAAPADGPSASWLVLLGLCSGGAAWFWWRKRVGTPVGRGGRDRQIQIEETRPLGNRQYLVVAAVGERKFLLGVTPGSIQLLAPLEEREEAARAPVA